MIDLTPILNPSFWLNLTPVGLSPVFERAFFLAFSGLILFGAVARIVAKNKKDDRYLVQTYQKLASMLVTMGFVGMGIFFFTYEEIYLFGARFWYILWLVGLVAWAVNIVRYAKVVVPKAKEEATNKATFNKYIPKRNR